jgi:hypothetical protein
MDAGRIASRPVRFNPYLPDPVRASIQRHLRRAVTAAVNAHESGQEDEDTLTGQLGFALRTRQPKRVTVDGQTWTWTIYYHKLRGRGPNATEHLIGADGLIEFSIDAVERHFSKTALFQAKNDASDLQRLLAQCTLLSTWREAAFIIKYGRERYSAIDLDDAFKQALRLPHPEEMPLDAFLVDVFIACLVGDSELHYEPADRVLSWRDQAGNMVHASFDIQHNLEIRVNGPKPGAAYRGTRIESTEIPEHRLKATDEEILGVNRNATAAEVKRARREAAKVYHVDKHQQLEPGFQDILSLRLKERNGAADRILARLRRELKPSVG